MRKELFFLLFSIFLCTALIGCGPYKQSNHSTSVERSTLQFWDDQRKGTNFMNSNSLPGNYQSVKKEKIEFVRLAADKWAKDRAFLFEDEPDQSGRDFLIGNADHYQGLVEKDLNRLKMDLDAAHNQGIGVILTMLTLPGDRWRQFNGKQNDDRIWNSENYQNQAARFWKDLAKELKGHPAIVGYNIVNEPHPETNKVYPFNDFWTEDYLRWYDGVKNTTADLNVLYRKVVHGIRAVDKKTPIILDSGLYAHPWAFKYLKPIEDKNVLYAFHMYEPYELTSQLEKDEKEWKYPGTVKVGTQAKEIYWNKDKLRDFLRPVHQWSKKNNVPSNRIIASEFGINRTVPGAEQYLQDLVSIFNENKWHWAFYAYREDTWNGMDYEQGYEKTRWNEDGTSKTIYQKNNPLWKAITSDLK